MNEYMFWSGMNEYKISASTMQFSDKNSGKQYKYTLHRDGDEYKFNEYKNKVATIHHGTLSSNTLLSDPYY
jgi:hypothetical protein